MPVLAESPPGRQRSGVSDSLVEGMRLGGTAVLLSVGSSGVALIIHVMISPVTDCPCGWVT